MEHKPKHKLTGLKIAAGGLLSVLVVLVLYVASYGPAYWATRSGRVEPVQLRGFYNPLGWAMSQSPVLSKAVLWYESWWEPAPRGRC